MISNSCLRHMGKMEFSLDPVTNRAGINRILIIQSGERIAGYVEPENFLSFLLLSQISSFHSH